MNIREAEDHSVWKDSELFHSHLSTWRTKTPRGNSPHVTPPPRLVLYVRLLHTLCSKQRIQGYEHLHVSATTLKQVDGFNDIIWSIGCDLKCVFWGLLFSMAKSKLHTSAITLKLDVSSNIVADRRVGWDIHYYTLSVGRQPKPIHYLCC